MSLFIVAVPLFDSEMAVGAYRLKAQDASRLLGLKDDHTALSGATEAPGIDMVNEVGIEAFTGGKPLFIDVNQFQILANVPQEITAPPDLIYFVVKKDAIDDPACFDRCLLLKTMGYGLAIENFSRSQMIDEYLMLSDYAILETTKVDFATNMMKLRGKNRDQKFVFTDIMTADDFNKFKKMGSSLFEGRFYSQPITAGEKDISPLKLNALQLLNLTAQDDFDLDEVSKYIRNDPAISISLLRFINSPGVGVSQKITSINNAVALLGQKETKKWISAAVSVALSEDKPNEITKLSLIRAKFAENLAPAFEMALQSPSLFMMGLFSLLDVILDKPMSEAVNEVSLDQNIREALVDRSGRYYDVLDLIYNYERAEWESVSLVMIRRNLDAEAIESAFIDALKWYSELLAMQSDIDEDAVQAQPAG